MAKIGRIRLSGFVAWAAWLLLHIFYLIDFRSRVLVLVDWAWSYFTYQRGSRLITGRRLDAGAPVSVGPPAAEPARDATMPLADRIAIQFDLAWAGDYNGLINGEVSDRTTAWTR